MHKKFKSLSIYLLLYFFLTMAHVVNAGDKPEYNINSIKEELKVNSKAVIRFDKQVFEVFSSSKAKLTTTRAITIINENGYKNSMFVEYYSKFQKITNIEGTIYDRNGKKVKSIKTSEIKDFSAISGYSVYEDNRVKLIDHNYKMYPFTIEYKFETEYSGLLNFPTWTPFLDYGVSVENSEFKVIVPHEYNLRYVENKYQGEVNISTEEGTDVYVWKAEFLTSVEQQNAERTILENNTSVILAPDEFVFDEYGGSQSNWENFGKWIYQLNVGRNELPTETINKVKELIKDAKSEEEKVSILYKYMQNKTRYVSIQVGIGGWQPFPASDVDRLGYGDCKALSNYMKALLDAANIKSYYTLVLAGNDVPDLRTEFSSNQFNHAIVCVPLKTDTIWLECTSQYMAPGYLGTFTDDRDVLLIDSTGGTVVHTKKYSGHENSIHRNTTVDLRLTGTAAAKMITTFHGLACDNAYLIIRADDENRKKYLYNTLNIPSFSIVSVNYSEKNDAIPVIHESLSVNLNNQLTKLTADKYIVKPQFFRRFQSIPAKLSQRLNPIFVKRSYIETDSVIYNLPEGYTSGNLPATIEIKTEFGNYTISYALNNHQLIISRVLSITEGEFPANQWDAYYKFHQDIFMADNKAISIVKK